MDQSGDFVFRKELERWAGALPGLTVTYIQTQTMNRKKREQTIKGLVKDTAQRFYISGPEGMVEAHEHLLIDMGVKPKNIRIDSFSGY
jgi:ferredoxin-NADP reductase